MFLDKHKRLIRFLITGGSAALVEYVLFLLFSSLFLQMEPGLIFAQVLSFCGGLLVSFFLNKHWSFQSNGPARKEFARYTILAIVNLILSTLLVVAFVDLLNVSPWIAKFIVMAMVAVWNYFLFQKLIFVNQKV